MTLPDAGPRRLRATIIGFGLDAGDDLQRLSTGDQCILVGGSAETHAEMLETMLRLESELERRGQRLADVTPDELADIAWRIDSPELHQIAIDLGDRPARAPPDRHRPGRRAPHPGLGLPPGHRRGADRAVGGAQAALRPEARLPPESGPSRRRPRAALAAEVGGVSSTTRPPWLAIM